MYLLLENHLTLVTNHLHLVVENSSSGELLALTWCFIGHLLKSPIAHSFVNVWDGIESLEKLFKESTYEAMLSAKHRDETGLQWWLRSFYYLMNCPPRNQLEEAQNILSARNKIQLELLRCWLLMSVSTRYVLNIHSCNTKPGQVYDFSMRTAPDASRPKYMCSFSIQQSFLFLIVVRNVFLDAMDILLASHNLDSFMVSLSLYPLYQRLQYQEIVENLYDITILLFEILEDAILMKNEVALAICGEVCVQCVLSVQHLSVWMQPTHLVGSSISVDFMYFVRTHHYVDAVYQHLTLNLSGWSGLASGCSSVDPALLSELVEVLEKFRTS